MTEREWVDSMAETLRQHLGLGEAFRIKTGLRLAYGYEIGSYPENSSAEPTARATTFQTDFAIVECVKGGWKPRVVVEAKLKSVTTHDAITYSHKASIHRAVHPYLRYGIMLGARNEYPLPGRLYRHGAQFDFMVSFRKHQMEVNERSEFCELLQAEVDASRALESILYESRSRDRDRYSVFHRKLVLK